MKRGLLISFDLAKGSLLFFMGIYLIWLFLFDISIVEGESMEQGYSSREIILVNKIYYSFYPPQRGDVVIFKFPGEKKIKYIKRIIGLPGEKVAIRKGRILVQ